MRKSMSAISILILALAIFLSGCSEDPFKNTDKNDTTALRKRGYDLLKRGKTDKAMIVFEHAVKLNGNDPNLRLGWSKSAALKRPQLSLREAQTACKLAYQNPKYHKKYKVYRDAFVKQKNANTGKAPIGSSTLGHLDRVKDTSSQAQVENIRKAIQLFKMKQRRVPRSLKELVQSGAYPQHGLSDLYGNPLYSRYYQGQLIVTYAGPDQVMETDDDMQYSFK